MKKYIIVLSLTMTMIALGLSCREVKQDEDSGQKISQTPQSDSLVSQSPGGRRRGQQQRQAVGRGFAKRGSEG